MYYGHPPHVATPLDLTILKCRCGWHSKELTRDELHDLGIPWYCDDCGKKGLQYIKFHPSERAQAYDAIGIEVAA